MTPAARRRAEWCVRAFPRRWRAEHADDLLATIDEMTPPDVPTLPWHTALDVVLAGWGERLRTHPPLARWLAYSLLGLRLGRPWHAWLVDDVFGRWFWVRTWLRRTSMMWVAWAVMWVAFRLTDDSVPFPWAMLMGPVLVAPVFAAGIRRTRRQVLDQHGLDPAGWLLPPTPMGAPWVPEVTASHPIAGGACLIGAGFVVAGAALLWGAAYPRATTHGPFGSFRTDGNAPIGITAVTVLAGLGLVLGLVLAVVLARAVTRRGPHVADRPPLGARSTRARRVLGAAFALAAAVYTWVGVVSLLPDAASAAGGAAAVAFGLGSFGVGLAARRHGRSGERAFTWADLMTSRSRFAEAPAR